MAMFGRGLLASLVARLRSYVRGIRHRSTVEAEMQDEFRHHIEMRAADLEREGLSPVEAARRAKVEFGHVEAHREAGRAARGLGLVDRVRFSALDVKLALRMLGKYPGLTLVAMFALGLGIPVGLAPIHLANALRAPLPEDEDDRIRALRLYDPSSTRVVTPTSDDLRYWSDRLTTFSSLGAFRSSEYNVASEDGRAGPLSGAEVTPNVFEMLGQPPLIGRPLIDEDARPGMPEVVVLSHDVWLSRFAGDPAALGRVVDVAGVSRTIVGVMPRGFHFPVRHQLWIPLELPTSGSPIQARVLGELSPGTSEDDAQAQAEAAGLPVSVENPGRRGRLRVEVVPFALSYMGLPRGGLDTVPGFFFFRFLALAVLLVACANVAMLVFARAATRFHEIAVRTALGAGRGRITSQLFVEALILSVGAAAIGLVAVDWALGVAIERVPAVLEVVPYWLDLSVTRGAAVRALGLAAFSATVAGVVPALRVTGKRVSHNIRNAEGGLDNLRFGGVTGALIVLDVAVSVAAIGFALGIKDQLGDVASVNARVGIPAQEYLAVELRLPISADGGSVAEGARHQQRLATIQKTMVERLRSDPTVVGVAAADALPRMDHDFRRVEVEGWDVTEGGRDSAPDRARWMRVATVDVGFFGELEQRVRAGRDFEPSDVEQDVPPTIVNVRFVEEILGGEDPIGRRLRFPRAELDDPPWHEIIGVVEHLGVNIIHPEGAPGVYVAAGPGEIHPLLLGIHLRGDPESFVPRLREIAAAVDPLVVLGPPRALNDLFPGDWYFGMAVAGGFAGLVLILVAMAATGLYAMVSYSVSRRTREIGIRAALGARRSSLVRTILRRALAQIGLGATIGVPVAALALLNLRTSMDGNESAWVAFGMAITAGVAVVLLVGGISCVAPTRRALEIEPSLALRSHR